MGDLLGRRVGHWLTDVTPLAPLVAGQKVNFTVYSAPWAGNQGAIPWVTTLRLRATPPPTPPPPRAPAAASLPAVPTPWRR